MLYNLDKKIIYSVILSITEKALIFTNSIPECADFMFDVYVVGLFDFIKNSVLIR